MVELLTKPLSSRIWMCAFENRGEVGSKTHSHVVAQVVELAPRLLERVRQIAPLLLEGRIGPVLDAFQVDAVSEPVDRADGDAARRRHPLDPHGLLGALVLPAR